MTSWDADAIGALIQEAYDTGEKAVRIRFSDEDLAAQAKQYFIEEGNVFSYCSGAKAIKSLESSVATVFVLLFL